MRARVKRVMSGVLLAVGLLIVGGGAYMLFLAHQIAALEERIVVPLPTEAAETAVVGGATPTPLAPYTPTPMRVQNAAVVDTVTPTVLPPTALPLPTAPPPPTEPPTEPPPTALPPTAPPPPTAAPTVPVVPPTITPAPLPTPVPAPPQAPPPPPATAVATLAPTPMPAPPPVPTPAARATLVPLAPAPPTAAAVIPTTIVILLPTVTPAPAPPVVATPVIAVSTVTPLRPTAPPLPPTVAPRPPFTVAPTGPRPPPPAAPTVLPLVPAPASPSAGSVLRDGAGLLSGESNGHEAVWGGKQVVRILLMGIDRRDDEPSRSDTMILATVDLWNGTVSLLSIPRDLVVSIPGYGEERVNAAFAFGQGARPRDPAAGPALAVKTVAKQFGVPVDHYLFVDFRAFRGIVDAVGGVDIAVARTIDDYAYPTDDYRTIHLHFDAGQQHMDGARALAYARTRHGDDDNARRERQMQVMQAVLSRAVEGDGVRRLPEVVRALGDNMQTSLPYEAQMSLAKLTRKMQANGVAQYSIKPPLVTGMSGTRWGDVYMGDWNAIRVFVAEATDPRRRQKT